jgi:hypothetical protein
METGKLSRLPFSGMRRFGSLLSLFPSPYFVYPLPILLPQCGISISQVQKTLTFRFCDERHEQKEKNSPTPI